MRSNGSRAMNSSGSKSRIFRDKREEMQLLPHPSPSLPNTLQAPGEDPSPLRQSLPPGLSLGQYGEVYSRAHSPLLQHHRPDCRAEGMLCDPKGPSRPLGLDIRIIGGHSSELHSSQLLPPGFCPARYTSAAGGHLIPRCQLRAVLSLKDLPACLKAGPQAASSPLEDIQPPLPLLGTQE